MAIVSEKVLTGECRFAFVRVFEPDNETNNYSMTLLIPKSDTQTLSAIKAAINDVASRAKAANGGRLPSNYHNPLRDGDDPANGKQDYDGFAGCYYLNLKSKYRPGIVTNKGGQLVPITEEADLYSGCYGRVTMTFADFNQSGNAGVSGRLGNILKTRDAEAFGGRKSAEQDFAQFADKGSAVSDFADDILA